MDYWVSWIRPFLQCFGKHLLRKTTVEIDSDGRVEMGTLVKECLPHGYREVRCRIVGDLIFQRERSLWESGYWDDDGLLSSRDAYDGWGSD
jgi:hypothetical protein